jgi:hypothetical protein
MISVLRPENADNHRRASRVAIITLLVVWVGFNFPVFIGRVLFPVDLEGSIAETGSPTGEISNPLDSDAYTLYYPLRTYLGERLRAGEIPLWDPHRFAGTPFAANAQVAAFYPPNWAFAVGDSLLTYSWLLVLTRLVGLLIAYWFFRVLSLHPLAAAGGATIFSGSGFIMAWGTHITFPSTAIWLPLALGGITRVFQGRTRSGVLTASVALGLAILAGHPQVTLYVWLSAVLWTVIMGCALVLERHASGLLRAIRGALPRLGLAILPFLLGLGLGSMQLLASLDFSKSVVRTAEPYESLVAGALPVRHLLTLVLPDRFGNPLDGNTAFNYTEGAMYVGVLTLVLIAIGIWHKPNRVTAGFLTLAGVGGLAAFGSPFFRVLYVTVPGLARLRGLNRFVFLIDVALAGLAAVGLDRMLKSVKRRRRMVLLGAALVLGALIASVMIVRLEPVSWSYLFPRLFLAASLVVAGAGLLLWLGRSRAPKLALGVGVVFLLATDLWVFGFRYHPFQDARPIYTETPLVHRLIASSRTRPRLARLFHYWIPANGALPHGLYDVQGYDNFIPSRYVQLVGLIEDQKLNARVFNVVYNFSDAASVLFSPIADLLGIRFVLAPSTQTGFGVPRFTDGASIFTRPYPIGPAYLIHCWAVVPTDSTLARVQTMDRRELRSIGIVDRETAPSPPARNSSCTPGEPVTIERYEPETVTVTAESDRPALLVITDTWDQGWKATIDGDPAPVTRVDHALRGVFLQPGRHRVELRYRPNWVVPGSVATAISLIALTAFGLGARFGRKRLPPLEAGQTGRDVSTSNSIDHPSEGAGG